MPQTVFKFEERHDYSPENFLVADSNKEAFDFITQSTWPNYAVNIYGASGCGKTYLAQISGAVVLENINEAADETELLHKINTAKEAGNKLVITSSKPISEVAFALPDLRSRLSAIPAIEIKQPDDTLLRTVLVRQFAARQLKVNDDILSYIITRIERSFTAAAQAVAKIDELSLNEKRSITIPLIKKIL